MQELVKLIGASVIGGIVILSILMLNINMKSSSDSFIQSTYNQYSLITASQIVEYDFYKLGYSSSGTAIIQADSNSVKFLSDIDNTGTVDTVAYYEDSTPGIAGISNPRYRHLYRKINNAASTVSLITQFNLAYADSAGTAIPYNQLSLLSARKKIKTIQVYIKTELPDPVNGTFSPCEWKEQIRPRNL